MEPPREDSPVMSEFNWDIDSLPDPEDLFREIKGTKKAPILIADEDQQGTKIGPATATAVFPAATATADSLAAVIEVSPAAAAAAPVDSLTTVTEASLATGMEDHWSRQGGDDVRSLRLRPQASLRATARLRDRSQRREQDKRSRSRGVGRKRT